MASMPGSLPIFAFDIEDAEKGGGERPRTTPHDESTPKLEYRDSKSPGEDDTKLASPSPYAKYAAPDARIWGMYLEEAEAEDKELMDPWNKDLDSLLVFAGLFAAILTAFLVESRKELYDDPQTRLLQDILGSIRNASYTPPPQVFEPPTSFLNINCLWFISLTLTLGSALGGVLSKGWIAKHSSSSMRKTSNDACMRHLRSDRIRKWRVGLIISAVSLLLQIALFLFFFGLVIILWDVQNQIRLTILALVITTVFLYLVTTFLPWFFPACPFQTPITEGTPWIQKPSLYGQRDGHSTGGSRDGLWNRITSLYEELRSVPKLEELRARILTWTISNTLNETVLKESFKALAGMEWTQTILEALSESGSFTILETRIPQYLMQARTSADEEWTCIILCIMLQMEQLNASRRKRAGSPFQSLLGRGSPLYTWQDFRLSEQTLAFSLRLHVLLSCEIDDPDENWQTSIHRLIKVFNDRSTSSERDILLGAVSRGTDSRKENIRRICRVITANILLSADIQTLAKQLEGSNRRNRGQDDMWGDYKRIPHSLCTLCLDDDSGIREGAIQALTKIAEDDPLCAQFEGAFEDLVKMKNEEQIPAILAVVTAMAQNGKIRASMKPGAALIMQSLENGPRKGRDGLASAMIRLVTYADLQAEVKEMIPRLGIKLDGPLNAEYMIVGAMVTFGRRIQFQPEIKILIPKIAKLLYHGSREMYHSIVGAMNTFSLQDKLQAEVNGAILAFAETITHEDRGVRKRAVNALRTFETQRELQSAVISTIPKVAEMLTDDDWRVRKGAVDVLKTFGMQGKCAIVAI